MNYKDSNGQIVFHERLNKTGLEFLHIQKGLFTEMLGADGYFYKYGEWPMLNTYLLKTYKQVDEKPMIQNHYLKKIELVSNQVPTLVKKLDRMGYNRYQLMPVYANIGNSSY